MTSSGRLGLLRHLGRMASHQQMARFVPGMFTSKLCYTLPLVSPIWGLEEFSCFAKNKLACTKDVILRLQTAQNTAARLMCPSLHLPPLTPTAHVLGAAQLLSVHQLGAIHTLRLAIRIVRSGRPSYLAKRLVPCQGTVRRPKRLKVQCCRLNISHEGFIQQATMLLNKLPDMIWDEQSPTRLKSLLRSWVSENVSVKP